MRGLLWVVLSGLLAAGGYVPLDKRGRSTAPPERLRRIHENFQQTAQMMAPFWALRPPLGFLQTRLSGKRQQLIRQEGKARFRVLVLRVEFQEDTTPLTTGNGKMRLEDNGEPRVLGVDENGDTLYNPFYDPPHTRRYFERLMDAVAAYYKAASYGAVEVEYVVMPYGDSAAYQLAHPMTYYGDPSDRALGLVSLVRDAFKAADQDSMIPDFDDLDPNPDGGPLGNGIPDWQEGVFPRYLIVYAGSPGQFDFALDSPYDIYTAWIPPGAFEYYLGVPFVLANEGQDTLWDAAVVPEMASQDGVEARPQGIYVHEMGHNLFFFPDLYDISGNSVGVGGWDIMATGGYFGVPGAIPDGLIPGFPSAWPRIWMDERIRTWRAYFPSWPDGFLGDTLLLTLPPGADTSEVRLKPATVLIEDTVNFEPPPVHGYRIARIPINDHEYFLLENRLDDLDGDSIVRGKFKDGVVISFYGEYDYLLPGKGMLIWHVDRRIIEEFYPYNAIEAARPMGLDLEEADGVQDLEKWTDWPYTWFGSPYDPFFRGNNDRFGPRTTPNSFANDGGSSRIVVMDISEPDTLMTARIYREWSQPGFPLQIGRERQTTYTLTADFTLGDAENAREIFVIQSGEVDSFWNVILPPQMYAVRSDGAPVFLRYGIGSLGPEYVTAPPAAADLDGDDTLDVVIPTLSGKLYVFSLKDPDGNGIIEPFPGFPLDFHDPILTSPTLGDFLGDPRPEIAFIGEDQTLHVIEGDGTERLRVFVGFPGRAPLLITRGALYTVANDGRLWAFDTTGTPLSGFPLGTPGIQENRTYPVGEAEHGVFFFGNDGFYGDSGLLRPIVPKGPLHTSPIVLAIDGLPAFFFVSGTKLYGLHLSGALVSRFPVELPLVDTAGDTLTPGELVAGDLEGEGGADLLLPIGSRKLLAYTLSGDPWERFSFSFQSGFSPFAPELVDLDGDGDVELIVGDSSGTLTVLDLPGLWNEGTGGDHWPAYAGGVARNPAVRIGPVPLLPDFPRPFTVRRLYFYPNPTHDGRTVLRFLTEGGKSGQGQGVVRIFDFAGFLIREIPFSVHFWTSDALPQEVPLDLSDLASGVYFVKIELRSPDEPPVVITKKLAIVR